MTLDRIDDGLLVRQVQLDDLRCCELLGPGDLLRPWDEDDDAGTIECQTVWRVLEPTRLALLDGAFARRAGRWPTMTGELLQRSLRRTRSQSVLLALTGPTGGCASAHPLRTPRGPLA